MSDKEIPQNRVNILLPLELSIQIERDIDKRGITKTQYVREAIHEKIHRTEFPNVLLQEIGVLKEEVHDLKVNIQELKSIILKL